MASKGILGRKLGMTQVWDEENRVIPVTVIQAGPCHVAQLKTPERDGYAAVQLAFGDTKPARLNKPELGQLEKAGLGASTVPASAPVADFTSNFIRHPRSTAPPGAWPRSSRTPGHRWDRGPRP